jgi:hypothetical protein
MEKEEEDRVRLSRMLVAHIFHKVAIKDRYMKSRKGSSVLFGWIIWQSWRTPMPQKDRL